MAAWVNSKVVRLVRSLGWLWQVGTQSSPARREGELASQATSYEVPNVQCLQRVTGEIAQSLGPKNGDGAAIMMGVHVKFWA
jgi:hypothetical protein